MAKEITEVNRANKVETQRRIRIVQEWILQDYGTPDIIQQAMQIWNIAQRQAYRYLYYANRFFQEKDELSMRAKVSYHVARKKKLIREMDPEERKTAAGVAAVNKVLDSIAKLQGITMDTVRLIGDPDNPIKTEHKATYTSHFIDYSTLPTEFLEAILKHAGKLNQ